MKIKVPIKSSFSGYEGEMEIEGTEKEINEVMKDIKNPSKRKNDKNM